MALYKNGTYLKTSDSNEFDKLHSPGARATLTACGWIKDPFGLSGRSSRGVGPNSSAPKRPGRSRP